MNKRILTLVLALVMVLGAFVPALAETEKITNPKVQWLIDNGIVEGRLQDDGKTKVFDLDKTITREEVTKLVIFHENANELAKALAGTKGKYSDVTADRWSNGIINAATVNEWVEGYPDKTFGPDRDITYAEVAAILVRLNSKWTAADEKNAEWPISYIRAAQDFGILKDVKIVDVNEKAVREKVFEMMYNAFDGRYEAPIVNDDLGVISYVWADKIELNDEVEYKIDRNTIFIGDSLNLIYNRADLLGSLVRVAIDEDDVLSHVVVLGQNKKAEPIGKWAGIASGDVISGDLDSADNDKVKFVGKEDALTVTDKTRVFVADVKNGNFYEAKKVEDAIDVDKADHLKGVYAAYDVQGVTDKEYARVIVFSSGKTPSSVKNLRRITSNVGRDYEFTAENTRAVDTKYTVKPFRDAFPYNYKFEKMDVVEFKLTGENGIKEADIKIDYSKDPVFQVTDVEQFLRYNADGTAEFRGNTIELKDEHGKIATFALDLDGVAVFTHTISKNDHVQVHFAKDEDDKVIDIISIVDKDLEGDLPRGEYDKVCGVVEEWNVVDDGGYKSFVINGKSYRYPAEDKAYPVTFIGKDGKKIVDQEALDEQLPEADDTFVTKYTFGELEAALEDQPLEGAKVEICFLMDNAHDNAKYVHSIEFTVDIRPIIEANEKELAACEAKLDELAKKVPEKIELENGETVPDALKTAILAAINDGLEDDPIQDDELILEVTDGKYSFKIKTDECETDLYEVSYTIECETDLWK